MVNPAASTSPAQQRPSKLDQIDQQLVAMLRLDGRVGNRELSQALGIAEATVRKRIERLVASRMLHVTAVVNIEAIGFPFYVLAWVRVEGRQIAEVAAELASYPEVLSVTLVLGSYDIFIAFAARDKQHLRAFVSGSLGTVRGVIKLDSAVAIECTLSRSDWAVMFETDPETSEQMLKIPRRPVGVLDDIDVDIIELLRTDGRMSNREIGRRLQVSEGTIRLRMKQLIERGIMRIATVTNLLASSSAAWSFVGLAVERGRMPDVTVALSCISEVNFVAITLGIYDIICTVVVDKREELLSLLTEKIARIPGVRRTETTEGLRCVKYTYSFVSKL